MKGGDQFARDAAASAAIGAAIAKGGVVAGTIAAAAPAVLAGLAVTAVLSIPIIAVGVLLADSEKKQ